VAKRNATDGQVLECAECRRMIEMDPGVQCDLGLKLACSWDLNGGVVDRLPSICFCHSCSVICRYNNLFCNNLLEELEIAGMSALLPVVGDAAGNGDWRDPLGYTVEKVEQRDSSAVYRPIIPQMSEQGVGMPTFTTARCNDFQSQLRFACYFRAISGKYAH
jgi:hypothetical protein